MFLERFKQHLYQAIEHPDLSVDRDLGQERSKQGLRNVTSAGLVDAPSCL